MTRPYPQAPKPTATTRPDFSSTSVEPVAEPLRGLRGWCIDATATGSRGLLRSAFQTTHHWYPGVNVAVCHASAHPQHKVPSIDTRAGSSPRPSRRCWWDRVPVPAKDCMCGFWAYTSGTHQLTVPGYPVFGIVEGYGRMVVGPAGFRAEKARIVALCIPAARGPVGAPPLRIHPLTFTAAFRRGVTTLNDAMGNMSRQYVWAIAVFQAALTKQPSPPKPPIRTVTPPPIKDTDYALTCPPDLAAVVRSRYPDVPMFSTVEQMQAEYPTTSTERLL